MARARFQAERAADRRRWRLRLVGAALAVVLLAALAVPTGLMFRPLPVRTAGDWVVGLELEPPAGWRMNLHVITPDLEYVMITSESGTCQVVAALASAPDENRLGQPLETERAWVHGRPVRYSDAYDNGAGVCWPYGDGGDVTLSCRDQDAAEIIRRCEVAGATEIELLPGDRGHWARHGSRGRAATGD